MKKRPCMRESDWGKFTENITDFLNSVPPKKVVKSKFQEEKQSTNEKNISLFTDEGNISWMSSEGDNSKHYDAGPMSSPVIYDGSKQFVSADGQCVKSTPAGSPILSQNNIITDRILVPRRRRLSLVPLSPITPGVHSDFSFPNSSHFSISIHEESRHEATSSDHTPLALPLPNSDDEVEDFDQSLSVPTQVDIEVLPSQNTAPNTAESALISPLEDSFDSNHSNDDTVCEPSTATCKARGSVWLEGVLNKIDNESANAANKPTLPPAISYDSTKKMKLVKNGMAERLQRLMKQEQTQKVLFKHQMKELQKINSETSQPFITLKVLSHHKDAQLHILECKVLSKGQLSVEQKGFCTVILKHQDVIENNLDLMKIFSIYPPWKELHLKQHNFPVLVCVYHVIVDSEASLSAATSQTEFDSQDNATILELLSNNWTRDCESLLEALEKQNTECGLCLVATVQRQYQQPCGTGMRWTWLCEDAFGVFFELSLETSLNDDVTWSCLIKHGEGQRIYFQKIFLTGRTTRDKSPALFGVIDSVWDPEGFGLLQVQNSQSQADEENTDTVQAPSFCYRFAARRWQSFCHCFTIPTTGDVTILFSDLNRPRMDGSTNTDVLYRHCDVIKCSEAKELKTTSTSDDVIMDDDLSNESFVSSTQVFVLDKSTTRLSDNISITVNYPHSDVALTPRNALLAKDLVYNKDEGFRTDYFSKIVTVKVDEKRLLSEAFPDHLYPNMKTQIDFSISLTKLPKLGKDIKPGCFVQVSGVVCGLSQISPTHLANTALLHSNGDSSMLAEKQPVNDDKEHPINEHGYHMLVMMSLHVKAKLKILRATAAKMLHCDVSKVPAASSVLNGRKFGPVNCYVYAKYVKTNVTLFYAEEVTVI